MAFIFRFPSTLCTAAALAATVALGTAPGVHAQQQETARAAVATATTNATVRAHKPQRSKNSKPSHNKFTATAAKAAADMPVAHLQDTYWKLVTLQGQPAQMLPGQDREVRITLGSANSQVQGFTGCNAVSGKYTLSGEQLKFAALASTRKMCEPAPNALEREMLAALSDTTAYLVEGERLMLLGDGRVLARFEAVYLR